MAELLVLLLLAGGVLLFNRLRRAEGRIRDLEGEVAALAVRTRRQPFPETVAQDLREATEHAPRPPNPWAAMAERSPSLAAETEASVAFSGIVSPVAAGTVADVPELAAAEAETAEPTAVTQGWRLEELFGARLPVWGGGIAIAFAGIFLVRYAIDLGLLTPLVRVGLGVAAGAMLLAAAETSRVMPATRSDPRIAQALAGAGIVTLYSVTYLAARSYALVPATMGILGMGAVTAAALLLAWRHGPATAILGLVGGFLAPAMLASDDGSVPLLLLYLAAAIAGMVTLGRLRSWPWLSGLGLAGGLLWAIVILATGERAGDLRALALFLLAAAIVTMLVRPDIPIPGRVRQATAGGEQPLASLALAAIASILLVSATMRAGLAPADWLLQGALGIAAIAVAARDRRLLPLPLLGLVLSVSSMLSWQPLVPLQATMVAAGFTLIYAPAAFGLLHRHPQNGLLLLIAPLATVAPILAARSLAPAAIPPWGWALGAAVVALPAMAAVRVWARASEREDTENRRLLVALGATLLLAGFMVAVTLPRPWVPAGFAALGLLLVLALHRLPAARAVLLVLAPAVAAILWGLFGMGADATVDEQLARTALASGSRAPLAVALGQGLAAGLLLVSATRTRHSAVAAAVAVAGMALAILSANQILPLEWRPALIAVLAIALLAGGRWLVQAPLVHASVGAAAFLASVVVLPALVVMGSILVTRMLASEPVLRTDLSGTWVAVARLILPGVLFGLLCLQVVPANSRQRALATGAAGLALAAGSYILLKQPFAIDSAEAFLTRGFAERATITAIPLLAGLALLRWRPLASNWAAALLALGAARLLLLDGIFYNPFFVGQSFGRLPLLNLLLVGYLLPAAVFLAARLACNTPLHRKWHASDVAAIGTTLMFGLASVAHAFRGPVIAFGEAGNAELYGYSAVAIVTALAALGWGTRTDNQLFRIASLILLLGAVLKAFLFDAAALDGLLRVASFLGLGLALIAVSWFYTRHVFARPQAADPGT